VKSEWILSDLGTGTLENHFVTFTTNGTKITNEINLKKKIRGSCALLQS